MKIKSLASKMQNPNKPKQNTNGYQNLNPYNNGESQ